MKLVDPDEDDDEQKCTISISLMQKYRRQLKVARKTLDDLEEAIGFDILKVSETERNISVTMKEYHMNINI